MVKEIFKNISRRLSGMMKPKEIEYVWVGPGDNPFK